MVTRHYTAAVRLLKQRTIGAVGSTTGSSEDPMPVDDGVFRVGIGEDSAAGTGESGTKNLRRRRASLHDDEGAIGRASTFTASVTLAPRRVIRRYRSSDLDEISNAAVTEEASGIKQTSKASAVPSITRSGQATIGEAAQASESTVSQLDQAVQHEAAPVTTAKVTGTTNSNSAIAFKQGNEVSKRRPAGVQHSARRHLGVAAEGSHSNQGTQHSALVL